MLSEEKVPIEQRCLYIQGILSSEAEKFSTSITNNRPKNSCLCFASYTYADLPLPKNFDVIFVRENPKQAIIVTSRVIRVTQQFNKEWREIPHGWKTICLIEFPKGVPPLMHTLPLIDGWSHDPLICLSTLETWQTILEQNL
jgi:hypothetical protein